jgi:hypothetical protein
MASATVAEQLDLFSPQTIERWQQGADDAVMAPATPVEPVARAVPAAPVVDPLPLPAGMAIGESPQNPIADAGEELRFNRRNRTRAARTWGDFSELNDALKVKEATKPNIWLKPDYAALIAEGMAPIVAHVVKQIYDAVAVRPMAGRGVLDDVILERYVSTLNRIERGAMAWATDRVSVKHWVEQNARSAGDVLGRHVAFGATDLRAKSVLDSVFPEGVKAARLELIVGGGNKLLSALQPGLSDVIRAVKAIDKGWPNKREAWEVQGFRVLSHPKVEVVPAPEENRNDVSAYVAIDSKYDRAFPSVTEAEDYVSKLGGFMLFGKRGFVDSFETQELAVEAAKELTKREKNVGPADGGTSVFNSIRAGDSRRMDGEDITPERMVQEIGIRGLNVGNWMKTPATRHEAQQHLNHAYDAFHDLAEILGVPVDALSLNGMLGLAIGAQGRGGSAAAHFVPGLDEINITRTGGAGFLAHEMAHALDHYFAKQAGLATSEAPYLSEHVRLGPTKKIFQMVEGRQKAVDQPRFGELRPEIIAAFASIDEAMEKRLQTDEEVRAQRASYGEKIAKSLSGWLKSIRTDFKGAEEAFDALAERVIDGDFGDGKIALGRTSYISPVLGEMRQLYKDTNKRSYSLDNTKALQSWIDSAIYQKALDPSDDVREAGTVSTEFAKNARALDRNKGGQAYWSTSREKFARAFDAFVSDSLEQKTAKNTYLATGFEDETVPMGSERIGINNAFRGLIAALKVRDNDKGAVIFSKTTAVETSMPQLAINLEIDRLRQQWPKMPRVSVVNSVKDLPFDAPENADGAFFLGDVFVVAENVADVKQLQKVMAHECIMHFAVEEMLGEYGFSKLHHGVQRLKAKGDPTVCALAKNIDERYGELPAEIQTREILARAGEMCLDEKGNVKIEFGFMKAVYAGITSWLRDHGLSIPFTNTEIQGVIHAAGDWIKREPQTTHAHGHAVYSGATPGALMSTQGDKSLLEAPDARAAWAGDNQAYFGRIMHVGDGIALQKTGRGDEVIKHSLLRFSADVTPGDVVKIAYVSGRATIAPEMRLPGMER